MVSPAVVDAAGAVTTAAVYDGMLAPDIYSGMGVAAALSDMLGGGSIVAAVLVVMLILALLLSIMTSMAGSSRTLYQASVDGWLPKYLSHVNEHGAPTRAMWTDLCFNLVLLMMSDYVFVLAASNVGYIIFNFLNLNAGWIHRLDRPNWERPYKAPTILLILGGLLSFVNLALMGMGADIWGAGTLKTGLFMATLIVPVFIFRHFIQDKGVFPKAMLEDMQIGNDEAGVSSRAGVLPYIALIVGVAVVFFTHSL
jgi:amino acid transporter